MAVFAITSAAFAAGGIIPIEHTCDGDDRPPPVAWSGAPEDTRSFVLIVHDPDAPRGDWVHWVLFDLPGDTTSIDDGSIDAGARAGVNDFGRSGWGGPCPPRGSAHHYVFSLYALDRVLGLPRGSTRAEVERAMRGHVLARAELVGRYQRRGSSATEAARHLR